MAPRTIFTKLASEEDAPVLASISMRFTVYPYVTPKVFVYSLPLKHTSKSRQNY